jgi:hypothetical protein
MASGGNAGMKIASILAISLGPFLVMADIASVMIVQKEMVWGFGSPGQVFPSFLGLAGLLLWIVGIVFLKWSKRVKRRRISSLATPIFLKGKNGFKCRTCDEWIDASDVDYHERITCDCGRNYDIFPETTEEAEDRSSSVPRSRKGNDRPVKRPLHRRSR